eukprot:1772489-Pleurochrysis_carterae.AAC.1
MITEARKPKTFLAELREDAQTGPPLEDLMREEIALVMKEYGEYRARDRCFTNYFCLKNAKIMPPATWRATYGKVLPKLAKIAQIVLAQLLQDSLREPG